MFAGLFVDGSKTGRRRRYSIVLPKQRVACGDDILF